MPHDIKPADWEAYLDEALSSAEMARIELALRSDPALVEELAAASARRDAGVHSLGAIWRRHRLTCPTRQQWGAYLLGALPPEAQRYYAFHLEMVGCRYCQANLTDLAKQQAESASSATKRRRKYFESSAGYLRKPGAR